VKQRGYQRLAPFSIGHTGGRAQRRTQRRFMASLPKRQARSRSATGLRRFSGIVALGIAHLAGLVDLIAADAEGV